MAAHLQLTIDASMLQFGLASRVFSQVGAPSIISYQANKKGIAPRDALFVFNWKRALLLASAAVDRRFQLADELIGIFNTRQYDLDRFVRET